MQRIWRKHGLQPHRLAESHVGRELAGLRAAAVMRLVQSARMRGHERWAYLRDVLRWLPTQINSRMEELLPHRWRLAGAEEPTA